MANISRSDLHHNFLRTVIFRLDFHGVYEPELEAIIPNIKKALKDEGFKRFGEKHKSDYNVNVSADSPDEPKISTSKTRILSFVNEDKGFEVEITTSNFCIVVNSTTYTPFEEYSKILISLYQLFKNNIDFISFDRIGLRKINDCSVFDKQKIKEFFKTDYFALFDRVEIEDVNNIISNKRDFIVSGDYRINLLRVINLGKIKGNDAYHLVLDIDVFSDIKEKIESILSDGNSILEMNDLSFKLFINSLTDSFIEKLMNEEDFTDENITGVENNE